MALPLVAWAGAHAQLQAGQVSRRAGRGTLKTDTQRPPAVTPLPTPTSAHVLQCTPAAPRRTPCGAVSTLCDRSMLPVE